MSDRKPKPCPYFTKRHIFCLELRVMVTDVKTVCEGTLAREDFKKCSNYRFFKEREQEQADLTKKEVKK